jgi:hypothetical protein
MSFVFFIYYLLGGGGGAASSTISYPSNMYLPNYLLKTNFCYFYGKYIGVKLPSSFFLPIKGINLPKNPPDFCCGCD